MRNIRNLVVEFGKIRRVFLCEGRVDSAFMGKDVLNQYRVSPIFPVEVNRFDIPDLEDKGYIGFYFLRKAFSVIGRLRTCLPQNICRNLWFGHGLASLIVFSSSNDTLEEIRKHCSNYLRGYESWEFIKREISPFSPWLCKPEVVDNEDFRISDFGNLEAEHRDILIELQTCILTGVSRAAQYAPSQLPAYSKLTEAVNEIIGELQFLENPRGPIPESLPKNAAPLICSDPIERKKRIHQRTGHLVQINSALSYVISQAYSGAIPIFENECHVRSFSLLGIGTAFLGLNAFSRFIESIFEQHPIDTVIKEKYGIPGGVDIFRSLQSFKPEKWKIREDLTLDALLEKQEPAQPNPKLTFFSGRLGFRESEFSVTAAIQVLSSAGTVQWSLMTITHELLHAHVRAILGAIFSDPQQRSAEIAFKEYYNRYRGFVFDESNKEGTRIESLRSILYNYCRLRINSEININGYRSHRESDKSKGMKSIKSRTVVPLEERLRNELTKKYREINEIIVHVLDHHYFYNADNVLYIQFVWISWSTVPAVIEKVEHYLWRSLITVGANETGSLSERFSLAVNIVNEALKPIKKDNVVVQEALRILGNKECLYRLKMEFLPGIYLAEMVVNFIRASCISASMLGSDKNINKAGDGYKYVLEEGEFPGVDVKNPLAFVLDRIRRNREGEKSALHRAHLAGWIFLACASSIS